MSNAAAALPGPRLASPETWLWPAEPGSHAFTCLECHSSKHIEHVAMPFVFHYLATELAAMNIKCNLTLQTTL